MRRFKYINASSVEEAASALKEYGKKAKIIAGGTDLLGEMKDDILPEYPEVLVNIKNVSNLDYIKEQNGKLRIGALTRLEDIATAGLVKEKYPLLAEAARRTASPHIREMGTIAGNICQNNRCWYYWVPDNRFYCLRKGGKACYAIIGDGRYHSIFGATRVNRTPCSTACPGHIEIPSYLSEIREGKKDRAAEILMECNPLPAITGRVCPHFCQTECNRGDYDETVSIRGVERFLGDYVLENRDNYYSSPKSEIKKKVAIIGSGPAGLSAAYYLRRSGYEVTIFERMKEAGGLLTYGIPPYRLPRDVVKKQVEALESMGIKFTLETEIRREKLDDLMSSFDAVFLACGAWKERLAGIPGETLLLSASEFLRNANTGVTSLPGKRVAVIGGGNVAIDAARSLLRLGSEPVVIYRRTEAEMPALRDEVEKAREEGIKIEFLTLPVEAEKKDGKIALKCSRMELGPLDESGRPRPVPVKGSEFITEYDAVMKAIGEEADTSILPQEFLDKAGHLKIDETTYSLGGNVFAGGDFVSGPATVIAAIAAGKAVSSSINSYLGGAKEHPEGKYSDAAEKFNPDYLKKTSRAAPPELSAAERIKNLHSEDVGGLEMSAIEEEANRCLNCGCIAVNSSDLAPALIALDAKIITSQRTIEAEKFFTAGIDQTTVLAGNEIVLRIEIPRPAEATRHKFIKFALRKSIDFPVVNCAAAITIEDGLVKSARVCVNSVYNLPYRAAQAEEYITGRPINESNAEAAAEATFRDAFPVLNNRYKIQIARTLVKRAILACSS
jgi:NADPH-dependent glutamate synthase beta subunit-like oxidoreductase